MLAEISVPKAKTAKLMSDLIYLLWYVKVWSTVYISLCGSVSMLTQCKVVYLRRQSHINQCSVVCVYIGLGQVGLSQSGEAAAEGGEEDG